MALAIQMSTIPTLVLALKAGADLSAAQHKFVKFNADRQVILCAAVTDRPIGVLQNKPDASGKGAEVLAIGVSKVEADESLSAGDAISTSADGQAALAAAGSDTTVYIVGLVIAGAANAAEIAEIAINCVGAARAQ